MRTFTSKLLGIAALATALLVLLSMVDGIVADRRVRQAEVEANIADTAARQQTVIGPVLVVPYRQRVTETVAAEGGKMHTIVREIDHRAVFLPEALDADGNADVAPRHRGLYRALLYTFRGNLHANFRVPANLGLDVAAGDITVGRAWLAMGVSDVRGLQSEPAVRWAGRALEVAQGTHHEPLGQGVHAAVGVLDVSATHDYAVSVKLDLLGTNSLSIAPVGRSTTFTLDSAWPHPSSIGRFLPRARAEGASYFPAKWSVSHLSSNAAAALTAAGDGQRPAADTLGVAFVEPVDIYLQSERALKYGVLFIGLTFAAFYLFELLKGLRIHPLQYGFVGLALTVFFLLLVSLSEHASFAIAYLVAAVACVSLVSYYLAYVLKGWRRAAAFGAQLATLYAALYGLLLSEDNALVMGAVLLFVVLAVAMIVTRRVDWYATTAATGSPR